MTGPTGSPGLLGDTAARDYSRKLQLFNAFAQPELRQAIASLRLQPGMRVLDAGCGTGEALEWLAAYVGRDGTVVGLELSLAHAAAARATTAPENLIVQGNVLKAPFAPMSFDLIWSVNTINHLHDAVAGVDTLAALLRPGGRIALGQSTLLPDMYFAWDARLERVTNEAVHQYYRDRYGLAERDLTAIRSIVGVLRRAGLRNVTVRTFMIERLSPLSAADERYVLEVIFRSTWGERLKPYLPRDDYDELSRLCDPQQPQFALRRADFHFLQSFTLAVGELP